MLQSIRDKTHGWIAGVIISMLILSFALWGIHSYLDGASDTSTVAKVNGTEISKSQLAVAYERLRRQMQAQYSSNYALPAQAESTLRSQALQTLITIQVLKQASLKQDFRISLNQVENLLESMPEFQVNDRFSMVRFQQFLATTLFSPNDFIDLLQTSLLIDQPRLGLLFTSFALPDEVSSAVVLVNQEREIEYAALPIEYFLNQSIPVSKENIQAYYQAHQNEFKTPEQVSVDYIQLSTADLMKTFHPSEQELKNFYTDNTNTFATPMEWQLDAILSPVAANATSSETTAAQSKLDAVQQQINKGTSFASLAHQYPVKAKLAGWVVLTAVPQELQKGVMTLTKPGQVTEAIKTRDGFILLKANAIKEAKVAPFTEVKDKVKDALARQQAEEKFGDLKEKLANISYEHPESLKAAASAMNLPILSSVVFSRDKGAEDISNHNKVREAAFSSDVLNSQNNSEVIQISPDTAVVLRIKTHVPAALLPLETVEKEITGKLKAEAAEALALKTANEVSDKLANGASLESINAQYHLTWNKLGYIGRHATTVDSAILDKAFAITKPIANKIAYAATKTPTGYAVIALQGVRDGNQVNNQNDLFAEQIQNSQGALEYELYKQSLIKNAKISVNNS